MSHPTSSTDLQNPAETISNGTNPRKPGELVFTLSLTAFSFIALVLSFDISGFESVSAPGVMPLLASTLLVLSALVVTKHVWTLAPVPNDQRLSNFLVPSVLINFVFLGLAYVIALTQIGFILATVLYLFVAILYLHRQGWLLALFVSLNSLAIVYIVFRLIFKVILPEGALIE